jgi:hypothetical protein
LWIKWVEPDLNLKFGVPNWLAIFERESHSSTDNAKPRPVVLISFRG